MKRFFCFMAVLLSLVGSAHGAILVDAGFESGSLSGWKVQRYAADRIQVIMRPVAEGSYAAKFTIRDGDTDPVGGVGQRAELYRGTGETEGVESWWGTSIYFPSDYSPSTAGWNMVTQWHNTGSGKQPNVSYSTPATSTNFVLRLCNGSGSAPTRTSYVLGKRTPGWHRVVLHVLWSSTDGFVEAWYDGTPSLPLTRTRTLYAGESVYLKEGLYRAKASWSTWIAIDDTARGESYLDVQ